MKLSEILFESVRELWNEAAMNPFVTAMADGSLDSELFKAYMLQDYYYLLEYADILEQMQGQAAHTETAQFLKKAAQATRYEMDTVHVPNMAKLNITAKDIQAGQKTPACTEYLQYLKETAQEGTVQGLAALLQCSWSYAYIAQSVTERYCSRLECSPYSDWFRAYTSEEYSEANAEWIAVLEREARGISSDETKQLCRIFERCARYENAFWECILTSE